MVFVPAPAAAAIALRGGQPMPQVQGFAATPSLLATLGAQLGDEAADYAALSTAGVAALASLEGSRRLVLAVEAKPDQLIDRRSDVGEVAVEGVRWGQVQALFADEPDAARSVNAAATAAVGVPLEGLLEVPAVVELGEEYDLLWYAVHELDDLG